MRAIILLALAGCSNFIRSPPPRTTPPRPVECTSSRVLPVVDLVGFGALGLVSYAAADFDGYDCSGDCSDHFDGGVLAVGLLLASPFLVSSILGFYKTEQCADRKQEWEIFSASQSP